MKKLLQILVGSVLIKGILCEVPFLVDRFFFYLTVDGPCHYVLILKYATNNVKECIRIRQTVKIGSIRFDECNSKLMSRP